MIKLKPTKEYSALVLRHLIIIRPLKFNTITPKTLWPNCQFHLNTQLSLAQTREYLLETRVECVSQGPVHNLFKTLVWVSLTYRKWFSLLWTGSPSRRMPPSCHVCNCSRCFHGYDSNLSEATKLTLQVVGGMNRINRPNKPSSLTVPLWPETELFKAWDSRLTTALY